MAAGDIPKGSRKAPGRAGSGRIAEMQHPLDRALFHPLAARLAHTLAPTPITPNMVSIAGGLSVVFAGLLYTRLDWPQAAVLGFAAHLLWHVLDGADGDLARMTGRTSATGEVVDGLSDYAGHIVLYLMLAGAAFHAEGALIWYLAVGAGISRMVQANFYEVQRRQYLHWAHGVAWLRTSVGAGPPWMRSVAAVYLGGARVLAPSYPRIDRAVDEPATTKAVRQTVRTLGPHAFAGSSLLGANWRTIALGMSMLAGSPLWFFLYEATLLNVVLAVAAIRARRSAQLVESRLQANPNTLR